MDLLHNKMLYEVHWSPACADTIGEIKWILCSELELCSLDFSKEFALKVDASEQGFGAILSWKLGDGEDLVLYFCRKLLLKDKNSLL